MIGDRASLMRDLCEAIGGAHEIEVLYGKDPHPRICQPHVVFTDAAGKVLLDAYQVSGHSSRPLPAWRCLEINQIRRLETRKGSFPVAKGYNPLNRNRYPVLVCWIGSPRLAT